MNFLLKRGLYSLVGAQNALDAHSGGQGIVYDACGKDAAGLVDG